jgi:Tfp pilus assembly protein PilF
MSFGPNDRKPPLKNMEAAVKDLETAIKLAPRNFFAHHNYAHAAYLLGYDNFAVYEFTKAIALNPNSGRSYMGRGFAYLEECNFKAAPPDFQKAVSLDPSLRSEVATEQVYARHRVQCTARPVPPPNFRATPGTDQYLDHSSDYWRLRTWEERPH